MGTLIPYGKTSTNLHALYGSQKTVAIYNIYFVMSIRQSKTSTNLHALYGNQNYSNL